MSRVRCCSDPPFCSCGVCSVACAGYRSLVTGYGLGVRLGDCGCGGGEVIDNVVSGLAKAGGTSLAASGEGSSIVVTDSLNKASFGNGSTISDMYNRTDNSMDILPAVEEVPVEEVVAETVITQ